MDMALYILIALLMFGILIALHELGHFITAKLLGVRVNEFAIGMGPCLWSKVKGETQYSLRAIPIGGYCAMEGEDADSDDPGAFGNKPAWKKFIVLVAGSFMNLLTGVVILGLLFSQSTSFSVPVVAGFLEGSPLQGSALQVGDQFLRIDGHRVYTYSDAQMLLSRAGEVVDLELERDGERIVLQDFDMHFYETELDGETVYLRGLTIGPEAVEATLGRKVQMTVYQSIDYVRMVWMSLGDLVTGAVGVQDMSGVIGILDTMGQAGQQGAQAAEEAGALPILGALLNILNLTAFIAINLAVMNLLPIPALDGGRILFLVVGLLYTGLTRRKLDPKYESYVNAAGFLLLILLMVVVAYNDVMRLIR